MGRRALGFLGFSFLAWWLAGCAAGAAPKQMAPADQTPRDEARRLTERLLEFDAELSAQETRPAPDCDRARELVRNICMLARRICQIADRHPDDAQLDKRCREARPRCQQATDRVAEPCAAGS